MKTCTKCKETKPLDEFSKRHRDKETRASQCKECHKEYHRNRNEQGLSNVYAGTCIICGKDYKGRKIDQKTCSIECGNKLKGGNSPGPIKVSPLWRDADGKKDNKCLTRSEVCFRVKDGDRQMCAKYLDGLYMHLPCRGKNCYQWY